LEKQIRLETVEKFGKKKATYPALLKKQQKHGLQKKSSPRNSVNDHLSGSLNY
jgi:hypothetical protein